MRLHTRAFAIASGTLASLSVFGVTLLWLIGGWDPDVPHALSFILFGYSVSVAGAFIGAMWAYVYGFLLGAGFAFAYNLAVVPPAPPPFDWESELTEQLGSEAAETPPGPAAARHAEQPAAHAAGDA